MERILTFSAWADDTWSKCITLEDNYIEKEEVDLNQKGVRLVTY